MDAGSEATFYVAAGSMALVGLLEGVTPCAHSWPVVAPFAVGAHRVRKAVSAAIAFFLGKIIAAPIVGAFLGGSHHLLPDYLEPMLEWGTAAVVLGISTVLLIRPDSLHLHTHCEDEHPEGEEVPHGHRLGHVPDPEHPQGGEHYHDSPGLRYGAYALMFAAGVATMFVPGSVWLMAAKMAQNSRSAWQGALLFEIHAVASGAVVLLIAWMLAHFAWAVRGLGNQKVEAMLVRITSVIVIVALVVHMALGHAEGHGHGVEPDEAEPRSIQTPADPHDGHDH